jgi:HAD superfamily hydrolase (TIGR01509 family)
LFDLVIFDCDGTLTDSEYVNNQAMLDVLSEMGFTHYDIEHAYKYWLGSTITTSLAQIEKETGRKVEPDFLERVIKRVQELTPNHTHSIPGAAQMVQVSADNAKICVASNGEYSCVYESLVATGLISFFHEDQIFTKSLVQHPKPAPDLFLYAANKMGVDDITKCLVIEDSIPGATAGIRAGMTVWGTVATAHNKEKQRQYLEEIGVHRIFDTMTEMAEAYREIDTEK